MDTHRPFVSLAIAGLLAFPQTEGLRSQEITSPPSASIAMAWDTLKGGLADNEVEHRKNAVAAIGTIGPSGEAVHRIEGALHDKDPQVRQTAAATLGEIGAKEAIPAPASLGITAVQEAIKTAKKDGGAGGRTIAAEVLGQDPDPYAPILLEWALGDDNWGVRVAVAKALGERGNSATIAKLEPLLKDDHHAVRYMAAASMIKLSAKQQISAAN